MSDTTPETAHESTVHSLYRLRMLAALAGYAVLLVASILVLRLEAAEGAAWRAPVALLPMLPALFGLGVVVRTLRQLDELEQRILLETFSFAFGGTFVVTFSYGLLQGGADFPHLNWMWVWPVMAALWIVGGQLARRRYR